MSDGKLISTKNPHNDPACGSSDAVAHYEQEDGSVTGYCWSCHSWVSPSDIDGSTSVAKPAGMVLQTPAVTTTNLSGVSDTLYPMELPHRSIRQDICAYFGDRAVVDPADGHTVLSEYYPYFAQTGELIAYQVKQVLTKDFFFMGAITGAQMYGQPQARAAGGKKLFITEGQNDAKALAQALIDSRAGTKYADMMPAVVSIAHGTGSVVKSLSDNMEFIDLFEEVIICFDMDDAGKAATELAARLLPPGKAFIAKYPLKDANDMLMAGKGAELVKAVQFNARRWSPASIKTVADVWEKALQPREIGIPWPWPTLTEITYGIHMHQLVGVGAGVGCGKTTIWHTIMSQCINHHAMRFGVFMLEEPPEETLQRISGSFAKKQFHRPGATYTREERESAMEPLKNSLILYDDEGERDWENVKSGIRHMVLVEGCNAVIVDPLTALTAHLDGSKANDMLNSMMSDLAAMVKALPFVCFYSCHLNTPKEGKSHEDGGRVRLSQFTGSRAMIRWSHLVLGANRDQGANDLISQNTTHIEILKHRLMGKKTGFDVLYDPDTGDFSELPAHYDPQSNQSSMVMPNGTD